jgi:hypothetical protein
MTLARHRSIRNIATFRDRYLAEHVEATWNEAGLAWIMLNGRQWVSEDFRRTGPARPDQRDYAAFVETARALPEEAVAPAHGLKWPRRPALIRATLRL